MKMVLLVLILTLSVNISRAQVRFGPKIGLNISSIVGTDAGETKPLVGYHGGGFARISLSEHIKIQPEILFSAQGAKTEARVSGEIKDYNLKMTYFYLPILFQYHSKVGLYAETGPQFGFLSNAVLKDGISSYAVKNSYNKTDASWCFGAGYQFAKGFGVNGRYNLGVTNIDFESEKNLKNSVVQLGISFDFSKLK